MSRIISRQIKGRDLRVIIDLAPGDALLVIKQIELKDLRLADGSIVNSQQIIVQPKNENTNFPHQSACNP